MKFNLQTMALAGLVCFSMMIPVQAQSTNPQSPTGTQRPTGTQSPTGTQPGSQRQTGTQSESERQSATGTANRSMNNKGSMGADSAFAMKAAQGGMAEVKLGQLATEKGSSQTVKDFGQKMVDDHGKANNELKQLASQKSWTLPTDISAKDQATYDRLSKLSGAQFDKEYMADMVKDHKADVAEFQREADRGTDPDLKAWAAKTLPTLQQHLSMAQSGQTSTKKQ